MTVTSIINFLLDIFNSLTGVASSIFSFFNYTVVTISGFDYSVLSLMFGAGIIVYFAVVIARFF